MSINDILANLGTPAQQAFWFATLFVAMVGLAFGDRSVRIGVGLVLGNFILSRLTEGLVWHTIQASVTALDGLLFGLLGVLAWRSRRWWAHGAAAFALLSFMAHFIALLDQTIWRRAYVELGWYFSAAVVVAILVGVAETPFARRYEHWASQHL